MNNIFFAENHDLLGAYPYDENYYKNMIQLILMMITECRDNNQKIALAKQFNHIIEWCDIYDIPNIFGISDIPRNVSEINHSEYTQADYNKGDIAYIPVNKDEPRPEYNDARYVTYIKTLKKKMN
jgi:hypothetical protein